MDWLSKVLAVISIVALFESPVLVFLTGMTTLIALSLVTDALILLVSIILWAPLVSKNRACSLAEKYVLSEFPIMTNLSVEKGHLRKHNWNIRIRNTTESKGYTRFDYFDAVLESRCGRLISLESAGYSSSGNPPTIS
jgi:hypothetical protein